MNELLEINVRIENIYKWGIGFLPSMKEKWEKFWDNMERDIFWSFFRTKDKFNPSEYLVTTGGSLFVHPQRLSGILKIYGKCTVSTPKEDGTYEYVRTFSEVEHLYKIMEEMKKSIPEMEYSIDYELKTY